jgi:hypothetical protein
MQQAAVVIGEPWFNASARRVIVSATRMVSKLVGWLWVVRGVGLVGCDLHFAFSTDKFCEGEREEFSFSSGKKYLFS